MNHWWLSFMICYIDNVSTAKPQETETSFTSYNQTKLVWVCCTIIKSGCYSIGTFRLLPKWWIQGRCTLVVYCYCMIAIFRMLRSIKSDLFVAHMFFFTASMCIAGSPVCEYKYALGMCKSPKFNNSSQNYKLYRTCKVCVCTRTLVMMKREEVRYCAVRLIRTLVGPVLVNVGGKKGGNFKYVTGSPSSRRRGCDWFKRLSVAVSEEHHAKMQLSSAI